jgi:predicted permease
VIAGIGFGLLAARRTSGADVQAVLKGGGRSVAGAASRGTLGGLVIAEVALALALLTAAGVMVQTFRQLAARDLGFDTAEVATVRVDLNADRYADAAVRSATLDRVIDRLAALPGVVAAGATTVNPLCCGNWGMRVTPEGMTTTGAADTPIIQHFIVTPRYFEVMKQPLVDGRHFSERDRAGGELVVIVDEAAAQRFWPGERAIGKRIRRGFSNSQFPWLTVVGVVRNALEEGEYGESWYLPFAQHATGPSADGVHLMIRSPGQIGSAVRAAIHDVDNALPVYDLTSMQALRDENLQQDRLGAIVATGFAVAGLLLAALGLYGVLSFAVNADRREIGVRVALGASRANVLRLVIGRGLRLTIAGLALGAAVSWLLTRALARVIDAAVIDPRVGVAAAIVLLVAALLATSVPARRALRTDPLRSLRG